ncbi:glycosyltransferase family 4 protein [Sphingosinicella sp. BN140058]|uniref:glycosyltransferase family 4 protein n=1 Tax=Sphingosinicella sp. BN140058 TaxID=1892855 RepID=UPI001012EA69|nr:glycosyltransferase family 4 protein [Sphingosinicella sp. BN140058]QAY77050.1 glycosyltransferase family 1 protein [Sphingosinicella sp. BN140058]
MNQKTILISINASWNILNFRAGLIRALQGAGYRVLALAPPDQWSEQLVQLGVEYHPLPMDKKGVSPARDGLLFLRYLAALRRLRPDVFLGYTAKPNIYGSLAAQALGIKVINNVSGLGTAFIQGGWLMRTVSTLYRLAFRRSEVVFFQNGEDRDLFLDRQIVEPAKARLLPGSGIDLERFRPRTVVAGRGTVSFLLVARMLWDKGVGEFVDAARAVRDRAPEARFQLLGFLDAENRTAVSRADVERWQQEGVVDYLGHSDDVRPFIAAADCVVLPSYREGLPRSLLEASAMAKPIIATDVPGCRHITEHGVNGFLCAPRDAGSLAEAMLTVLRLSKAEREALGAAGRAKARAEFDERIVTERYVEAIAAALDNHPRS